MPLQAVDIAIIKATTAKFSVVPKEKHVRSEHCMASCVPQCLRQRRPSATALTWLVLQFAHLQ
jgi:hypothetical protein